MTPRERIARLLSPLLDVALRSRTTVKFFLFPVLVLPFANFILDTTFTLFRRLIRREKWYQAHRSHFYQRMTDLGMTLHPGRSRGADRVGGFRDRRDRLRRSLGTGQGTCSGSESGIDPRNGGPQNRDVHGNHRTPPEQGQTWRRHRRDLCPRIGRVRRLTYV